MGIGFRKSFGKGPFRVTLSPSGISTRVGGKYGGVSMSKHGVTGSANSGVGLTYRKLVGKASKTEEGPLVEERQTTGLPKIVVAALVGGVAYLFAVLFGWL